MVGQETTHLGIAHELGEARRQLISQFSWPSFSCSIGGLVCGVDVFLDFRLLASDLRGQGLEESAAGSVHGVQEGHCMA